MNDIIDQLGINQKWHWDNYIHYDRAFSRYLLIGGGASIGLILNFLKSTPSPFQGCISFDMAVWLFTSNILIAGLCIYLNSQYAALNVKTYSSLIGYYNGGKQFERDNVLGVSNLNDTLNRMHERQQTKPKIIFRVINYLQGLSAFLFACGLLMSVYLATKLL